MDPLVKTILPLITWKLQKAVGPLFRGNEWRAVAQSLVPPPDSLVRVMTKEPGDCSRAALLSPSARRRVRAAFKREFQRQLRGNPMPVALRQLLIDWRRKGETAGYTVDPARIRKQRQIEAETNEYYSELAQSHDLAESFEPILGPISQDRAHDVATLCWEFATYGEGGTKPQITRNSEIWGILGIDPDELAGMTDEAGLKLVFSRFVALLGLNGGPPDEARLSRLLRWMVRTHLPPEDEPKTTPRALSKAAEAGLIHRASEVRGEEAEEAELQVEDSNASRFIREVEVKDELDRITSLAKLSSGERLVLMGMREGLEGAALVDWVEAQGKGLSRASVPVLAARVRRKLRQIATS